MQHQSEDTFPGKAALLQQEMPCNLFDRAVTSTYPHFRYSLSSFNFSKPPINTTDKEKGRCCRKESCEF